MESNCEQESQQVRSVPPQLRVPCCLQRRKSIYDSFYARNPGFLREFRPSVEKHPDQEPLLYNFTVANGNNKPVVFYAAMPSMRKNYQLQPATFMGNVSRLSSNLPGLMASYSSACSSSLQTLALSQTFISKLWNEIRSGNRMQKRHLKRHLVLIALCFQVYL